MPQPIPTQSDQKEGRMILAICAFEEGSFNNLKAAAIAYDVSYSTIQRRVKGVLARRDLRPASKKLTDLEESAIEQWILSIAGRGLPLRAESIRQMANLLLQKRSDTGQDNTLTVGKCWVQNFVRRHDSLQSRYTRKYVYQRAKCEDPTIIRDWFRLVQNTIAKYGILDEDIYNFDETGFQMGVITTAKVITGSERAGRLVCI
jgi:hypothetical protein